MPELVLYERKSCPFCQKVLQFLEGKNIDVTLHDITQDLDAKAALVRAGGTGQVPCLLIDGKLLYESDAIIAYFEKIA